MSNLLKLIANNLIPGLAGTLLVGFLLGFACSSLIGSSSEPAKPAASQAAAPAANAPAAAAAPALPAYLDANQIQLIYANIVTDFNNQDGKALYNLLGPNRKAQVSQDLVVTNLVSLYQKMGQIHNGSLVNTQYLGQSGPYKVFSFNFSVEYEKAKRGVLSFMVLDNGSGYQIDSVSFNQG